MSIRVLNSFTSVIVSFVLGFPVSIPAQDTPWTPIGPPGQAVRAMAFDPGDAATLYAGTNDDVYVTRNGGVSWRTAGLTGWIIGALSSDPFRAGVIYAGTLAKGVWKSEDYGVTWQSAGLDSLAILSLARDPDRPQRLWAGASVAGIWRSEDGGMQWTFSGLPAVSVQTITTHPKYRDVLYAGSTDGLYVSEDDGGQWRNGSAALTGRDIRAFLLDPVDHETLWAGTKGGVYRSWNGGVNWTAVNGGLKTLFIRSFSLDPIHSTVLYAGTHGDGVFTIERGGWVWEPLGLTNQIVLCTAMESRGGYLLYAGTGKDGIFKRDIAADLQQYGGLIRLRNAPNPFQTETVIVFELLGAVDVTLTVYNILGQSLGILHTGPMTAGEHRILWRPAAISSGIYVLKIEAGAEQYICKMLLLR